VTKENQPALRNGLRIDHRTSARMPTALFSAVNCAADPERGPATSATHARVGTLSDSSLLESWPTSKKKNLFGVLPRKTREVETHRIEAVIDESCLDELS
jgi:hypothetical protein